MRGAKNINLALQGGGAHGAFTWGALERLLEEPKLIFDGISATSAGAMNAAVLKSGLLSSDVAAEGRDAACRLLETFWTEIAKRSGAAVHPFVDFVRSVYPSTEAAADFMRASPAAALSDIVTRTMSPYAFNPLNINPLRDLLQDVVDFDSVCQTCAPHLYISATNVRTGKIRIFTGEALSTEAILASACLPHLFQAVEIFDPASERDEAYWDGGYMGNPALFPLFDDPDSRDILIVNINPIERDEVPTTPQDIANRINEISFNSSLLRELRAIDFVRRLIEDGSVKPGQMKDILIHQIRDDAFMGKLNVATKMQADWRIMSDLRDAGRAAATDFLKAHWKDLGSRSSVDLRQMFS